MMRKVTAIITALVIGVACFSVTVYAWFQASITNTGNKIESAEYGIKVSITTNGTNVSPDADDNYDLAANTEYSVTLIATGDAEKGYCVMSNGSVSWNTQQILPGKSMTFTLIPEKNAAYTFKENWGSVEGSVISDGDTIGSKAAGSSELKNPNTVTPSIPDKTEEAVSTPEKTTVEESVEESEEETMISSDNSEEEKDETNAE